MMTAGVQDSLAPARPNRSGLGGRRPGRFPSWSNRQADGDVNGPDRGDRSLDTEKDREIIFGFPPG
jgi:hypothetical protein